MVQEAIHCPRAGPLRHVVANKVNARKNCLFRLDMVLIRSHSLATFTQIIPLIELKLSSADICETVPDWRPRRIYENKISLEAHQATEYLIAQNSTRAQHKDVCFSHLENLAGDGLFVLQDYD